MINKSKNALHDGPHINIMRPGAEVMTTSEPMQNRHIIAVTALAHGLPHPRSAGSHPQGPKVSATARNLSHLLQSRRVGCTGGLEVRYASFSSSTTDLFFVLQNFLGSGSMLFSNSLVYLFTVPSRLMLVAHVSDLSNLDIACCSHLALFFLTHPCCCTHLYLLVEQNSLLRFE